MQGFRRLLQIEQAHESNIDSQIESRNILMMAKVQILLITCGTYSSSQISIKSILRITF